MSENDGSTKSSSGTPSGSSRLDSASAGSGMGSSGGSNSNSGTGPESGISQHSHGSSLKGASTSATDSAYGSISQSQKSGSGSGSRSSKSQVSSNSSNATASAEQQPKQRKEKDSKKRKSNKASSIPPIQSPGQALDRPGSACSNKGASSAAALISAASTVAANACSSSTVDGNSLLTNTSSCAPDTTGGGSCTGLTTTGSGGKAEPCSFSAKTKLPRTTIGIRGLTESRAVQAAALSRALDCLKGVGLSPSKESQRSGKEDTASSSLRSILADPFEKTVRKTFAYLEEVPAIKSKEAFITAISLHDGIVVYVTSTLTEKLGYPTEMWCGRSLLDFIHPKDRLSFTNHITSKLLSSLGKEDSSSGYSFYSDEGQFLRCGVISSSSSTPDMVCCRLRMYRGLRTSGFSIVDKKTSYMPFKINLSLERIKIPRDLPDASSKEAATKESAHNMISEEDTDSSECFLLVYAEPISSAYKTPEDRTPAGQFGLRHSANCLFSEVDLGSVPYLGHLPQDLLGTSALDFYHPNDLPELKKIYDSIIGRQGKSVRSKPYSFRAFNGCYVLLETDWTCFVNPWTKKLEFVAGHHRVLKGPSNPDVFANPPEGLVPVIDTLDPAAAESIKKIQAEICTILTGSPKPLQQQKTPRAEMALLETSTRRRKNLATLMGSLIDEVAKAKGTNSCGNSCSSSGGGYARCKSQYHSPAEEGSLLGDASVVMGDISTHGGSGLDSSSADTPLSYSLLNYNQNLERYFQSQPKMMPSDGSGESSGTGSIGSKPSQIRTPNVSSEEEGGCLGNSASGTLPSSDSQKLSSSISQSTDSQNGTSSDPDYKGLPLTKEVLGRHNEIMEKEFMQLHKELRHRTTGPRRHGQLHTRKETQGVKRGQASSWEEGGTRSRHKHPHMDEFCATPQCYQSPSTGTGAGPSFSDWASLTGPPSLIPSSLLPPFSVSAPISNQPSSVFSIPLPKRSDVTNSLPAFYLAASPGGSASSAPRPVSVQMNTGPFVQVSPHHQHAHPLGPAYSLQPYATYSHGVIYQPVVVPPVLFQPGVGMMIPTANVIQQQQQPSSSQSMSDAHQRASRDRRPQPYSQEPAVTFAQRQHSRPSTSYATEGTGDPSQGNNSSSNDGYRQYSGTFREPQTILRGSQQQSTTQQTDVNNGNPHTNLPGTQNRSIPKRTPPWMEAVSVSSELVYQYQMPDRNKSAVLEADREKLRVFQQPVLLNHQLLQLYTEMEAEHRKPKELALEECETSTSSSSAEDTNLRRKELRRRSAEFRRTMLYEENAPFPQPTDG